MKAKTISPSFLRIIFVLIIIVHINNIKIIYYDRIEVSEGIDVKKDKCIERV